VVGIEISARAGWLCLGRELCFPSGVHPWCFLESEHDIIEEPQKKEDLAVGYRA